MADSRKRGRPSKKSASNSPSIDSAQDETLSKDKGKGLLSYSSDISSNLPSKASLNPSPLQVIRATLEKEKSVSPIKSAKRTKKLNVFELVSDDDESPLAKTSLKDTKAKKGKSKVASSPIRGKTSSKNTKASAKSPKSSPLKKSEDKSEKQSKGKKTAPSPRKPSPKKQTPAVVSPSRSRRGRPRGTKQSPSPAKGKRGRPKKTQEVVEKSEETLEDAEEQTQVVVKRVGRKRQSSSRTTKTVRSSTSRAKRTKVVTDGESPLEVEASTRDESETITEEDTQPSNIESSGQEESVVSRRRTGGRKRNARSRNDTKQNKQENVGVDGEEERKTERSSQRGVEMDDDGGMGRVEVEESSSVVVTQDDEERGDEDAGTVEEETELREDPEKPATPEDEEECQEVDEEDEDSSSEVISKRRKIGPPADMKQQQQQQEQQQQQQQLESHESTTDVQECNKKDTENHQADHNGSSWRGTSPHSEITEEMDMETGTASTESVNKEKCAETEDQKGSSTMEISQPSCSVAPDASSSKQSLDDSVLMSFTKPEASPKKDVKSLSSLTKKTPSLVKTASWPKSQQKVTSLAKVATTKAQGPPAQSASVKKTESQQEKGEKQMFFEEIYYLLDSFVPAQPVSMRSFSIVTMATNCLKVEFRKKLNTYRLAPRIMTCLQDAPKSSLLRLSTSFLLFMFTRDFSLPLFFDRKCFESMASILEAEVNFESNPEGHPSDEKDSKEYGMLEKKVRFCLEQWSREQYMTTSGKAQTHQISTELLSPGDLIIESIIAITNPRRKQHFKNVLRQLGVLDPVAKRVMHLIKRIEASPPSDVISEDLDLLLKRTHQGLLVLEQVILNCYDNQCYLVIFEGSALVCSLTKLLRVLMELVTLGDSQGDNGEDCSVMCESRSVLGCLLTLLKLLSGLTHDNEMACIRLGENAGVMDQVVKCTLQAPHCVGNEDKFHVTILGLTVLINLTEHSPTERAIFKKPWYQCRKKEERGKTILEHIVLLFCKHFSAADSIDISLPNMIEQPVHEQEKDHTSSEVGVSGEGVSQPAPPTMGVTDSHGKLVETDQDNTPGLSSSQSGKAEMNFDDSFEYVSDEDEEESFEHEKSVADLSTSLVINRDEFNQALEQAGQQLEDSLIAFYCALLLGTLSRHDRVNSDVVRSGMPSKSFSEMVKILENFLSFLDYAKLGSKSSTDSVREIVSFLSESEEGHSKQD